MLKGILIALSLIVSTSAMAAITDPQLYSLDCRAENGVILQTTAKPRAGNEKVTVESRYGFFTKTFIASLDVGSNDVSAVTLEKDGEVQYNIAMQLDLTSSEEQIVRGVLYGSYLTGNAPRVISEARCKVILRERLP